MKTVFEGYVIPSKTVEDFMEFIPRNWQSQSVDDSYHIQRTPLYDKPFEGGKKIRVTVEEIQ